VSMRDKIRSARDIQSEVVDVPEWGVAVEVRSMSVRQRAAFVAASQDQSEEGVQRVEKVYGGILVSCVYDPETNEPVFDEDDLSWLMTEKSGAVIDNLVGRCLEVSGLKEKAIDEAGKSYLGSPTQTGEPTQNDALTSS